jgi:acetyl-CoA carboxylase biotin carboxyl carrier protein
MIDFAFLERLLELLQRSDAQTIEIRRWTTSVRISKAPLGNSGQPVAYQIAPPHAPAPPLHASPAGAGDAAGAVAAGAPPAEAPAQSALVDIKSPMVGTFYAQPEPGAEPYVRVGSRVSVGQTLCIIEAMKIMNPLDSEMSGVIREVLIEDAQPVEFGQILFRVDPHG